MKKNVCSVVLGVSMLLFWGCSSDSASSVNPENPINSKTSTCALVNNYLPASSILYSDDGRGGCIASGQSFSNDEYMAYDAALVAMGFKKSDVSVGSASYTKSVEDASIVTVDLSYVSESQILSAVVTKQDRIYVLGDVEKVAKLYIEPVVQHFYNLDLVWNGSLDSIKTTYDQGNIENLEVFCSQIEQVLTENGWTNVNIDYYAGNLTYIYAYMLYENKSYSLNVELFGRNNYNPHYEQTQVTIKLMKL